MDNVKHPKACAMQGFDALRLPGGNLNHWERGFKPSFMSK